MPLELTPEDRAALDGERGAGVALAMRIVTALARAMDAPQLIDISSAHIDGCLYHGQAGLDFARRLVEGDTRVVVPTTLNVSSLDLLHPELVHLDRETAADARALMDAYVEMGGRATWTCAPYQLPERPGLGDQIAWAESNAIVFANSVLGARTNRYGDFIDICCAVTGRAPFAGLHTDEGRRATRVMRLVDVPGALLVDTVASAAIGHLLGRWAGTDVVAIVGMPTSTSEDQLKALGAAAASSGAVAMFHAVGVTPEAPTLEAATGGRTVPEEVAGLADLHAARDELSTVGPGAPIGAVSVGTPHFSVDEFERLAELLADGDALRIPFYVNTGRDVLATATEHGWVTPVTDAGASVVTDTCTYITPIIRGADGPVMTNSGKWAWYAPGNMGIDVAFGSLEECVRSARNGMLERDEGLWGLD